MDLDLDRIAMKAGGGISGLQVKKQQCEYTQHYWTVCTLKNDEDGKFYVLCTWPQ